MIVKNRCYLKSCGFPADELSFHAQIFEGGYAPLQVTEGVLAKLYATDAVDATVEPNEVLGAHIEECQPQGMGARRPPHETHCRISWPRIKNTFMCTESYRTAAR